MGLYFKVRDNIDTHGFSQGKGEPNDEWIPVPGSEGRRDLCLPPRWSPAEGMTGVCVVQALGSSQAALKSRQLSMKARTTP